MERVQLLDKYDVRAVLEEGASRTLYHAALNDRDVLVLKTTDGIAIDERAKTLDHPNIHRLESVETDGVATYLVYPHLVGVTLYDRLSKHDRFSTGQAVEVLGQILAGLSHAHEQGVVHGAISAKNIWLSKSDTGGAHVSIAEFGQRVTPDSATKNTGLGPRGEVVGAINGLSPESIIGQGIKPESDIYAIGVLFLEMLLAQPVFMSTEPLEVLARHLRAPVRIPGRIVNTSLGEFIARATNKRPEDRFANASVAARLLASLEFEEFQVRVDQIPMQAAQSYMGPHGVFSPNEALQLIPAIPYVAQSATVQVMLSNDEHQQLQNLRNATMGNEPSETSAPDPNKYRVRTQKLPKPSEEKTENHRYSVVGASETPKVAPNQETVMVVMAEEQLAQIQNASARPDYLIETQELNAFAEEFKLDQADQPQEGGRRIERDLMWVAIVVVLAVCAYFFLFHDPTPQSPTDIPTPSKTNDGFETF